MHIYNFQEFLSAPHIFMKCSGFETGKSSHFKHDKFLSKHMDIDFHRSELKIAETTEPETTKLKVTSMTGEPYGPRVRFVSEQAEEESSDDEVESESEDEDIYLQKDQPEVPSEFWHIQKLIKYMKAGNQTATMVSLCLLKDYDLTNKVCHALLIVHIMCFPGLRNPIRIVRNVYQMR